MVANEAFLDTAILRENVVSRAKELNYIPSSVKSASAKINLTIAPNDNPVEIVIPAYTKFTAQGDNVTYTFSTQKDYTILDSGNGSFSGTVDIYEGDVVTYTFTVNSTKPRFEIPNPNLDVSSLVVNVYDDLNTTTKTTYSLYDNLINVDSESLIYFVEENGKGNYDVYFGDGVLGKPPAATKVVRITGRFSAGTEGNSFATFTPVSYVAYNKADSSTQYQAASVSLFSAATGGQDREDIDHVRMLAPKFYSMQNRLVTEADYQAYIMSRWSDLTSVAVWGGEKNDPPYYGKVLISVKPNDGFTISSFRKQEMVAELTKRSILAIDPVIADPTFAFIQLDIKVSYNSKYTTLSQSQLYSKVSTAIQNYEALNLGDFNQGFRLSDLTSTLNSVDASIVNIDPTMKLEKRIAPIYNDRITYKLRFNMATKHPYDGYLGGITSTGFKISGSDLIFYLEDDGFGNVVMFTFSENKKVYNTSTSFKGTINYSTGEMILKSLIVTSTEDPTGEIRVMMQPDGTLYYPIRNEIMLLSYPSITMFDISAKQITLIQTTNVTADSGSPVKSNQLFIPILNQVLQ
jgi:hypothetical protein